MQYQGGKSRVAKEISEVILTYMVGGYNLLRYQGGKSAIAKSISNEILLRAGGADTLISLFCGACSVEVKLAPHFENVICNDNHKYLIALLKGVQEGYELPDYITEEQYKYVREHQDEDEVLTGFVGFGSSFGGKWFGGYGRSKHRSHAKESKSALLRDNKYLQKVKFLCMDYRDVYIPDGCVIYADPPYDNTTQYGNVRFNSNDFWEYAREVSKTHLMFISELSAPDDFISIWQKPITRTLDRNKSNQFKATENLYVHKCNLISNAR